MQAIKGYVKNGQFYPIGKVKQSPVRVKAVLTILDEPLESSKPEEEKNTRVEWLSRLNSAISNSINEELPDIVRSKSIRNPLNLAD